MLKKEYAAPLLSLVMIGLLIALAFFTMLDHTLAWFANNDTVNATGMNVSARGIPETEQYLMVDGVRLEEGANELFTELMPGEIITFQLYVKNKTNKDIELGLSMAAPTENDDQPYVTDGLYHYMGTQIRINSIKNLDSELLSLTGNERYLLTLDDSLYIGDDASLPPTATESAYDFSALTDKSLTSPVRIAANGELFLDIELEFVDNGISQNAYIDYGNSSSDNPAKRNLTFSRTLFCSFAYVS